MRTISCVLVGLVLFAAAVRAETTGNYTVESRNNMEIFTSKIVKVYQFQEGDMDYVAYVVNWRDHEVVVQPMPLRPEEKHHAVGEVLRCSMTQMYMRRKDGTMAPHVMFAIWPANLPVPAMLPGGSDPAELQKRLDAVSAEVARRHQKREAAMEAVRSANESLSRSEQQPTPTAGEVAQQQHLDAVSAEFSKAQEHRDADQTTPSGVVTPSEPPHK